MMILCFLNVITYVVWNSMQHDKTLTHTHACKWMMQCCSNGWLKNMQPWRMKNAWMPNLQFFLMLSWWLLEHNGLSNERGKPAFIHACCQT